jgi:hypothetical protein
MAAMMAAAWPMAHAQAQTTTLAPPAERISDRAIQADHRAYEALQARIKGLNDRGRPVRDYFLSKAQCWLDVSFHEYTRNDRGPFPQAAMTESEKLIQGMEQGTALSMDTPLVAGAVRLRPDLWDRASALRGHAGWRCAAAKAACAEVELVHAGHEHQQLQWRHAKPYVQIAEDLIGEAQQLAEACVPPPPHLRPPPPRWPCRRRCPSPHRWRARRRCRPRRRWPRCSWQPTCCSTSTATTRATCARSRWCSSRSWSSACSATSCRSRACACRGMPTA